MLEHEDEFIFGDDSVGVPAGSYFATFDGWKPTTTAKGPTNIWSWTITAGPYKGQKATCFLDPVTPKRTNKFGRILSGLAGKPLSGGDRFNARAVIGKTYMVVVTTGKDGKGTRVDSVAVPPSDN